MKTDTFISALDDARITNAIESAEKTTSGEIRVFITNQEIQDALLPAEEQFVKLGMDSTELHNAVLIYFAPRSQTYAVVGGKGVHEKCGQPFWQEIAGAMNPLLKEQRFTDAIVLAIERAGAALARHFPYQTGDRNELPNQVVRDDTPRKSE